METGKKWIRRLEKVDEFYLTITIKRKFSRLVIIGAASIISRVYHLNKPSR